MSDRQRAKEILLAAFWTSEGWRPNPAIAPEEFDLAKAAGLMFEPSATSHDAAVHQAVERASALLAAQVADAFVASLSSRRLEYRSALGSFAIGRHLRVHSANLIEPNPFCLVCGQLSHDASVDWNVLNFERYKWGGVRHDSPSYIAFDLREFGFLPEFTPTAEDWDIFRSILTLAQQQAPNARPGHLEKAISKVMRSNKSERRVLLQILGYAGILQPHGRRAFFDQFVPVHERAETPEWKDDWAYPMRWWRGSDGIRTDALQFWFPTFRP